MGRNDDRTVGATTARVAAAVARPEAEGAEGGGLVRRPDDGRSAAGPHNFRAAFGQVTMAPDEKKE